MTFSISHSPILMSELRSVFSLTAGTCNLGHSAIAKMRSATATVAASGTISMTSIRGKGMCEVSAVNSSGSFFFGYAEAGIVSAGALGTLNNTSVFGRAIKALYVSQVLGRIQLVISASVSSGYINHFYATQDNSYTALSIAVHEISAGVTTWTFNSGQYGMSAGASGPFVFYID